MQRNIFSIFNRSHNRNSDDIEDLEAQPLLRPPSLPLEECMRLIEEAKRKYYLRATILNTIKTLLLLSMVAGIAYLDYDFIIRVLHTVQLDNEWHYDDVPGVNGTCESLNRRLLKYCDSAFLGNPEFCRDLKKEFCEEKVTSVGEGIAVGAAQLLGLILVFYYLYSMRKSLLADDKKLNELLTPNEISEMKKITHYIFKKKEAELLRTLGASDLSKINERSSVRELLNLLRWENDKRKAKIKQIQGERIGLLSCQNYPQSPLHSFFKRGGMDIVWNIFEFQESVNKIKNEGLSQRDIKRYNASQKLKC